MAFNLFKAGFSHSIFLFNFKFIREKEISSDNKIDGNKIHEQFPASIFQLSDFSDVKS